MQAVTITQITPPELEVLIQNSIKQVLKDQKSNQITDKDFWFDLNELCNYLPDKPAKPTVYGWVHLRIIPFYKGGKKLRFLKSEIDRWLGEGRQRTTLEIERESGLYLNKARRVTKKKGA